MTDDRLRQLYARALGDAAPPAAPGAPCEVGPEALLALARGELPEEERLALFDRVMASESCRRDFALVRAAVVADAAVEGAAPVSASAGSEVGGAAVPAVGDELADVRPPLTLLSSAPAAAPRPPRADVPRRARTGGLVALAATLLLAVGLSRWGGRIAEPVMRGVADAVVPIVPPDGAQTDRSPAFAWHPAPAAERYVFELLDGTGAPVYTTTTADTVVALPGDVMLRPGADYRWIVRGLDAAGQPRGEVVRRLRVRPL